MKLDKESDLAQRRKDSWWDVELFRVVEGRLPNQPGDTVTKATAKRYLDRFHMGGEKLDSSANKQQLDSFAFHVYATTNLAYESGVE